MKQDYVLKKHVRAESIEEALRLAVEKPFAEVYLAADKPERLPEAVGFRMIYPEE